MPEEPKTTIERRDLEGALLLVVSQNEDGTLETIPLKGDEDGNAFVNIKGATITADSIDLDTSDLEAILTDGSQMAEVVGNSEIVSATIANTAEAYTGTTTAPVCLGVPVTLTSAMRVSGGKAILQTLKLIDTNNIKPSLVVMFFNQAMTNGTYTNKSQPVFSSDAANYAGMVTVNSSDWQSAGNPGVAFVDLPTNSKLIKASGSANLYALVLVTGSFTWTAANSITLKAGFIRD